MSESVNFLGGPVWNPTDGEYGILPLIFGSFVVMLGALVLGTPLAVGTAVFLSEIASPRVRAIVRPAVELLAGIPSVIYRLLRPDHPETDHRSDERRARVRRCHGLDHPCDHDRAHDRHALRGRAAVDCPTVSARPRYAMGATTWQTIYKVLVPAAKIGIIDAIILGMGRAIGETMAVLMVVGNAPVIPDEHLRADRDAHHADRHGHALRIG